VNLLGNYHAKNRKQGIERQAAKAPRKIRQGQQKARDKN
jgi:hypothetical protein